MKLTWKRGSLSLLLASTSNTRPSRGFAVTSLGKEISNRLLVGLGAFLLCAALAVASRISRATAPRPSFCMNRPLDRGRCIAALLGEVKNRRTPQPQRTRTDTKEISSVHLRIPYSPLWFTSFAQRTLAGRGCLPGVMSLRYSFNYVRRLHRHRPLVEEESSLRLSGADRRHRHAPRRRRRLQIPRRWAQSLGRPPASRLGGIQKAYGQDHH